MFKKLALLSVMLSLGACESINQAKQCDPDKNYIISNTQAIQDYQKLKSEGKIRSYYHNDKTNNSCKDDICVGFDVKNYDFIEMYFNDEERKGVYTIIATKDFSSDDCFKSYEYSSPDKKLYCYKAIKNLNNNVISTYEWTLSESQGVIKQEFSNIKNKTNLFKVSYQVYSTNAIGGPGGGICPQAYINHPEFKFNPYAFP